MFVFLRTDIKEIDFFDAKKSLNIHMTSTSWHLGICLSFIKVLLEAKCQLSFLLPSLSSRREAGDKVMILSFSAMRLTPKMSAACHLLSSHDE